jgi:hypothetical protein
MKKVAVVTMFEFCSEFSAFIVEKCKQVFFGNQYPMEVYGQ